MEKLSVRSPPRSDDRAQPVAFLLLSAFPMSRFLSDVHPLSLFLSPATLEILVYFDSQTLPLSRDPTLQIYSTYFYQPQNARRQGKQGSASLGFNLLPPHTPTLLSFFDSKSLFTFTLCKNRVSLS